MDSSQQNSGPSSASQGPAASVPVVAPNVSGASALPLQVSDRAAAQVKVIQEREGKLESVLRVSVVGGGCSGLSYKLSFDAAPKEKDKVIEHGGVRVVVDGKSALFLRGTVLDFTDGLNGQGFVFTNPNAKSTCGCGSSFSA